MCEALVKGDSIVVGPCVHPCRPVVAEGSLSLHGALTGDTVGLLWFPCIKDHRLMLAAIQVSMCCVSCMRAIVCYLS